ncbi:MAG: Ig-like domain-containing protein [Saprospiraceae bacterium]|nr:Ig-like domain-containing protein [Saprospiraceae bacterium]
MSPTGGPKDETPPKLVSSIPADKSLNFKGKSVELVFDEKVKIAGLKNELIITPTYYGEYDFKQEKYGLIIEFEDPFDDSTTYNLNFREAIQDVTESNPAENLKIAFSTWGYLDSLSISGSIYDLLTEIPVSQYLVGIYDKYDTLSPLNGPPLYFSKTNDFGYYSMENIRPGLYDVYSFEDKNDNLTLESKSESYGFMPDPILLDYTNNESSFGVTNLDLTELEIQSARQNGQYYEVKASKYITDYEIKTPSTDSILYSKYAADHKGIILFNTFDFADSLELHITVQDSLYTTITDTLYISYRESQRQKDEFRLSVKSAMIHKENKKFEAELEFTKPVTHVTFDSLFIEWDSLRTTNFDTTNIIFGKNRTTLKIESNVTMLDIDSLNSNNKTPILSLKDAAFLSLENDSSINRNQNISIFEDSKLGIISGSIRLEDISYFVQLIDESNKIIRSEYNTQDYLFEDLLPGTYRLRLLLDDNNDGIWHPGNLNVNQPPERVFFYVSEEGNSELILRANWELIDINVNSLLKTVEIPELESEQVPDSNR